MKKYIKPSIEVLIVEAMDQILDDSSFGWDLNPELGGDQNAPRRKVYIEDDWEDDDSDYGW